MNYKIFFLFVFVLLTSFSNLPNKPIDNIKSTATAKLPVSRAITTYNELSVNSDKTPSFESFSIALEGFYKLKEKGLVTKDILTLIDFSKSSNTKRLWVINLATNEVFSIL